MMFLLGLAAAAATICTLPAGWMTPLPVHAALTRQMYFALKTGKAYTIALAPAISVRLERQSRRIPKPGTWAGLAALDIAARGKVTIALSSAAYIDLVRGGVTLASVAHQRTGACPTMHKTVTFDVVPGRYLVQLTDAPDRSVVFEATLG
jgi:hypothetical protein